MDENRTNPELPRSGDPEPPFDEGDELTPDLVAFLDGELDVTANEAVEAKISLDATIRAEADALKKTWELLDYLPRSEPSPSFTERTISRIEPLRPSGPAPAANGAVLSGSGAAPTPPRTSTAATPALAPLRPSPSRRLLVSFAWLFVLAAAGLAGYFTRAKVVEHFTRLERQEQRLDQQDRDAKILSERRLLKNLRLYRNAEDLDFVQQLDEAELFGDEPGTTGIGLSRPMETTTADHDEIDYLRKLYNHFQSLPEDRQEELRTLDREFHELDDDVQSHLRAALERYNYWLAHLRDDDRRRVEVSRPGRRIEVIAELRERDWVDTLPKPYRIKYYDPLTSNAEKRHLVKEWRQEEKDRDDEWEFIKRNQPEKGGLPKFIEDNRTKTLFDLFVLNLETQLPPLEAAALMRARTAVEQEQNWLEYALVVARLSDRHPLLPGPPNGPRQFSELPEEVQKFLVEKGKAFGKKKVTLPEPLAKAAGRWPDFAVAVTDYARAKGLPPLPKQLGPARKDDKDMPAEVRTFIEKVLEPTLQRLERQKQPAAAQAHRDLQRLKDAQDKWPDYPRTVIELARQYRLIVPGWTLPPRANFRPDLGKKLPRDPGWKN